MNLRSTSLSTLGLLIAVASATAQPPGGVRTPDPFSPYLNLTRQGATPAVNYYGLVRPQNQFSNAIQDLQRQIASNPYSAEAVSDQSLVTGHAFGFQNQGAYFQNQFMGGGFGGGNPSSASRSMPGGAFGPQTSGSGSGGKK
jgi:hypothetical protein